MVKSNLGKKLRNHLLDQELCALDYQISFSRQSAQQHGKIIYYKNKICFDSENS